MRLNRYIASSGAASRRGAEEFIVEGGVTVNGAVMRDLSYQVAAGDVVECNGVIITPTAQVRLWKYHKPRGVICTDSDPQGRPTVHSQLPTSLGRVLLVGRLDVDSEGLLLLTNSGELKRALELPVNEVPRSYRVRFYGALPPHAAREIKAGVTIEGVHYRPATLYCPHRASHAKNHWCDITLSEGKNREVRRIFAHYGCSVNRLQRTAYGDITLDDLPIGAVEEVQNAEATVAHMIAHKK